MTTADQSFIQALRDKQTAQQQEAQNEGNNQRVKQAVDSIKTYVTDFANNKENCFCHYIKLQWRRWADNEGYFGAKGEAMYDIFDANKPKDVIACVPKVAIFELERELSKCGLSKSFSISDDGYIKLDWGW